MLRQLFFVWCFAWTLAVPHAGAEETLRVAAISPLSGTFAHRAIAMLARAVDQAHSDDPMMVALALEGIVFDGPEGRVWMRPEDHQFVAPLYLARLTKVGEA